MNGMILLPVLAVILAIANFARSSHGASGGKGNTTVSESQSAKIKERQKEFA